MNQIDHSTTNLDLLKKKGYPMKRLLALAVAVAAITMMAETDANAQGYTQGYNFGVGINAAVRPGMRHGDIYNRRGFFGLNQFRDNSLSREFRREKPPYFATFPPVYYSNIVKRPYGVSPYAAPSGIVPVEMLGPAPAPVSVTNPFFNNEASPAKAPVQPKAKSKEKVTWNQNPYLAPVAQR
jgi:hypothetical protein